MVALRVFRTVPVLASLLFLAGCAFLIPAPPGYSDWEIWSALAARPATLDDFRGLLREEQNSSKVNPEKNVVRLTSKRFTVEEWLEIWNDYPVPHFGVRDLRWVVDWYVPGTDFGSVAAIYQVSAPLGGMDQVKGNSKSSRIFCDRNGSILGYLRPYQDFQ
jgi:hypothetical protein